MDPVSALIRHLPRQMHWLGRLTRANREAEMALLGILCDRRRTSIDVGAKTGMYSYRLLARSAAVAAFEPNPELAGLLRAVFGERLAVHEVALSEREGMTILRVPSAASGLAKPGRGTVEEANRLHAMGGGVRRFEVAARRLDDYGFADAGFIKIDVEGHEQAVLAGAGETIGRCRPNLLVEANDAHAPGAVAGLRAWAEAAGYWAGFLDGERLRAMGEPGAGEIIAAGIIENFILLPRPGHARLCDAIGARLAGPRRGRQIGRTNDLD